MIVLEVILVLVAAAMLSAISPPCISLDENDE